MVSTVKVRKHQLAYFRRLARNSNLEIQAYLLGEVVSPSLTVIHWFMYCKEYELQTSRNVQWTGAEYARIKQVANELNLRVVGDLHSHPNWDAVMSPDDYTGAIEEGQTVNGICSVSGRRTRVRFWNTYSALPYEVKLV